jgi:hydroxyacylglutathione hydrolase
MILRRLYDEKLAHASYLIGCPATGEAIVVDPHRDADMYLQAARSDGLRIVAVTETHIHADYASGSRELAKRAGVPMYLSDTGPDEWKYRFPAADVWHPLRDGDALRIGAIRFDVVATPGHTPEHVTFVLTYEAASSAPVGALTGDFIFVGDVGRPDLLERAASYAGTMERGARDLFRSLQAFKRRPPHLLLWPGHGAGSACGRSLGGAPATTLGYEMIANWAFRIDDESEFVRDVLAGQPDPPKYFAQMKRINREGPRLLGGPPRPPRLDDDDLAPALHAGHPVIDVRVRAQYQARHAPGTWSLPLNKSFTGWVGWFVPYDRPIRLITLDENHAAAAARDLALIGIDDVAGWFPPSAIEAADVAGAAPESTGTLGSDDVRRLVSEGRAVVVDVRNQDEWDAGRIPGAIHVPLGRILHRLEEIPRDRAVIVSCETGSRSNIGASLLQAAGIRNVYDHRGGYADYMRTVEPTEAV